MIKRAEDLLSDLADRPAVIIVGAKHAQPIADELKKLQLDVHLRFHPEALRHSAADCQS